MTSLNIRQDACDLDFLAFGAVVHRLDPGQLPFRAARSLEVHVSGGEYNVAANLRGCFGLQTGVATAMVDYGIGELVESRIRERGVRPFFKRFSHDGMRGPNIATVYQTGEHEGVRFIAMELVEGQPLSKLILKGGLPLERIFDIARSAGIKCDQGAAVDIIRCKSEGCRRRIIAHTDRERSRKLGG